MCACERHYRAGGACTCNCDHEGGGIAALIARSSLGTAEAVAARASVSDETAARIVASANRIGCIYDILRDHVVHAGSGGTVYWVECLSVDCGWSEHGEGTLIDATEAHRGHLASEIERQVYRPAVEGGAS